MSGKTKKYFESNRLWWNKVTPTHAKSDLYDLENFKKGKTSLQDIELSELKQVKRKKLLHLLCHFGQDTLSWARKGAFVTGVDISDEAIRLAKKLSKDINVPAEFICSDVYELPKVLDKKFDIVYASYGVLCWLPDLPKFVQIVKQFLDHGGVFYMAEVHPFTSILSYDFKFEYKYFKKGPYLDDSSGTYTDWNEDVQGVTYEWSYTISDVINAFIQEGFVINFVHEFPYTMYDQFPGFMEKNAKGQFVLKNKKIQIPLLFSIKVTNV